MVVEDFGVQVEVGWDQSPGDEEGDKTEEGTARLVAAGTARADYVYCAGWVSGY